MFKRKDGNGNDESFRVTRIAKNNKGEVIKRTGLHQIAQPTYKEYQDAEYQLKQWAMVQTEWIMREMATATPEELRAMEFDEGDSELGNRVQEQEKELGD
jgi:hypothetical protein